MKNFSKRALALFLTFIMVFACVPLAGTDFGALTVGSVASAAHTHKKVTSVKKATLSKDGTKTVTCSTCKKTFSKTAISKITSVKLSYAHIHLYSEKRPRKRIFFQLLRRHAQSRRGYKKRI